MTKAPLYHPIGTAIKRDEALDRFLAFVANTKLTLYPAQEEAILELFNGHHVILNTPTGSGKSLVALACHYCALSQGKRSFYTSPVKALVNEKFFSLCRTFGADTVGLITGDAKVNADAPVICCTAEILSNMALREGDAAAVDDAILDEFHYYGDRDRGGAWQIPLLTLPQTRFLLMSATFGDTSFFEQVLSKLNKRHTSLVQSFERPVPLNYSYSETHLDETVQDLLDANKAPIYIVSFSQKECAQLAQAFMSINFCTKEEKKRISQILSTYSYTSPYGKEINKYLRHGIGIHHAGLLPKYRILVEKLAQQGLLKIICGTDTLGVGVNIPIRTVLLTKLCKYDGQKTTLLSIRDFHQVCGRAGRKGFDDQGYVVLQAPAHVIENKKKELKAALNPKSKKKMVKAKPPEKGFIPWSNETFQQMIQSAPETLRSQFKVDQALILAVLSRPHDNVRPLKQLLKDCHETKASKRHLRRHGFKLFRTLLEKKIVEIIPKQERLDTSIKLNVDLNDDFILTEALALYLLDTLKHLDPMDENYTLNLLSLIESIIENPKVILYRQIDRLKKEALIELKQQGLDYEERLEELEKIDYIKPNADFIYNSFNTFHSKHPWVSDDNIRPKSIVREMYEHYHSFSDYIREYDLQKAEGVLLRYLSSVYKVLAKTIPDYMKTDEVDELTLYLKNLIKSTDSSLLNEWEQLQDPTILKNNDKKTKTEEDEDITQNDLQFNIHIRNSIFQFVKYLAYKQYDKAYALITNQDKWTTETLEEKMTRYYDDHECLLVNLDARNKRHTIIRDNKAYKDVQFTMTDPEEKQDWHMTFMVDLAQSKASQTIHFLLNDIGPID